MMETYPEMLVQLSIALALYVDVTKMLQLCKHIILNFLQIRN